MSKTFADQASAFCVTFTRGVIAWNMVEEAARSILLSHASGSGARAAIIHLGNVALSDAILTVVDVMDDPEFPLTQAASKHIKHFIEGMDVLRVYRNFYVHSLLGIGHDPEKPDSFRGKLHSQEARGQFIWIEQHVTTDELSAFLGHSEALYRYGNAIAQYLTPSDKTHALPPWLEKPKWPEKLKKNRERLGGPKRQQKPSQA